MVSGSLRPESPSIQTVATKTRKSALPTLDAILAGCAATVGRPGDEVIIASSNVRHLSRFPGIDAREWTSIMP